MGSLDLAGTDVAAEGNYAYLTDYRTLKIVSVANPGMPEEIASFPLRGMAEAIAVKGCHVYVATSWQTGLQIIDVSNPLAPQETGFLNTVDYSRAMAVAGSYAYLLGKSELQIIDVSNPAAPVKIREIDNAMESSGLAVEGSFLYMIGNSYGLNKLIIHNISNPAAPSLVTTKYMYYPAWNMIISGSYAYLTDQKAGLMIIDISKPEAPEFTGIIKIPGRAGAVAVTGCHAYVTSQEGIQIIEMPFPVPPIETGSLVFLPESKQMTRIGIAGSRVYSSDGSAELQIIDISNPAKPVLEGVANLRCAASRFAISGSLALVTSYHAGLWVFDISNPVAPVKIGFLDEPENVGAIAVSGSFVYMIYYRPGHSILRTIDISNPAEPKAAGFLDGGDSGWRSLSIAGSTMYMYGSSKIWAADISNPGTPAIIGSIHAPSLINIAARDDYVYGASGNEMRIFDFSNPSAPLEKGIFKRGGTLAVHGSYVLLAESGHGLRLIDATNPDQPGEIAFTPFAGTFQSMTVANNLVCLGTREGSLNIFELFTDAPPAPANLTAGAVSFSRIDLTWTAPEGARDGFHLERRTGVAGDFLPLATLAADRTGYSDTGLLPGTAYTYRIRAFKGILDSDYSAPAGAVTPACDPPVILKQPAGQSVWPGESVTLSVTAAGTEPLHYTWYQIAGGQALPAPGAADAPAYTTPALVESASFRVRVSNACGTAESAAVQITVESELPPPGTLVDTDPVAGQLRFVPPCTFTQGSPADEPCRKADETPFTSILDSGLAVMETEVTRGMWAELRARQPELPPDPSSGLAGGNPELPVQGCTWREAVLFANLLSREAGLPPCYHLDPEGLLPVDGNNYQTGGIFCLWHRPGFRLPAETEYEWYSRAGTAGAFPVEEPGYDPATCGTCQPEPALAALNGYAWWCANSGGQPQPAGGRAANPWNLYDLAGNVAEWCQDWYGPYPAGTRLNYTGPVAGQAKAVRGGGYEDAANRLRPAARHFRDPEERSGEQGFRLVRTCRPDFRAGGWIGVGVAKPERALHLAGDNAVFRLDRSLDSAAFLLVRTTGSGGILKAFLLGTEASGPGTGQFVIRDPGAAAGGPSTVRMTIQNDGTTLFPGNVKARGFVSLSTIRAKEEIRPLEDASASLSLLHGVRFRWKDETGGPAGRDDLGFIAGAVQGVLPEAAPPEAAGVSYPKLLVVALEALKSQQAKLDEIARQRTVIQESLRRLEAAKPRQ